MRRRMFAFLPVVVLFAASNTSVAITNGELDGEDHPYVGLMVAKDADGLPLWRCSGALLDSTHFLTAGHCTEAPAVFASVWFDSDVESGIPENGYPTRGDVPVPGGLHGTVHTHSSYNPNAFFLHDLGMVVLDEPVEGITEFASLPTLDVLDQMAKRRGQQDVSFTAVGYGLQQINPVFVQSERVRMVSHPKLNAINVPGFTGDFSVLLSNNHSTGGTCFGDSGGPNFIGDTNVIGGVTSFGLNGNCAGTGGVYRVDRADDLEWLADTFNLGPPTVASAGRAHAVPEPSSAMFALIGLVGFVQFSRKRLDR